MMNGRRIQRVLDAKTERAVVTQLKTMERDLTSAARDKGLR